MGSVVTSKDDHRRRQAFQAEAREPHRDDGEATC